MQFLHRILCDLHNSDNIYIFVKSFLLLGGNGLDE